MSVLSGILLACRPVPPAEEPRPAVQLQGESPDGSPSASAPTVVGTATPLAAPEPGTEQRVAELTPYEVLGSTLSPDGSSWCILDVRLEERVPRATLRALWESLRKEQPTEWGRFTCRFYLDGDCWADVNDLWILESPAPAEPSTLTPDEMDDEVAILRLEGTCILCFGNKAIALPVSADRLRIRGSGADLEIEYWDGEAGRLRAIRRADLEVMPPLPPCGSAWFR